MFSNLQTEIVRSKSQIYEQSEKPTKYFYNLEKKKLTVL